MRLSPSLTSRSWPCCCEAHFLGGVPLFQASDPAMGTSLVGATLPNFTSGYHTQAGREQQGDLGFLLLRRNRRRSHSCSVVPELGRRPRQPFRDPFPHPPGPPSLACKPPDFWVSG